MTLRWLRLFYLFALAFALAGEVHAESSLEWWQTSVIYQIYPRSFKDSNGDGVGDLNGITEQVDYLADLGVGAIWISPFFKSPMVDFGYDISDFRAIDPIFGTMDDFIRLKDTYHKRGIKVLLDLVPNHSSDTHEWFQKSVKSIAPFADYYVWVKAKQGPNGTREPPCNWKSRFNSTIPGSMWEWNDGRQAYYLHQFFKEQPDLNYRNPAVIQEMKDIIRFWLDLGVDGFRVDAVPRLIEDDRFLDEGPTRNHSYNQPGSFDIVYEFRTLLDSYKKANSSAKFMVVEGGQMRWYGNGTVSGAHFPFNFRLVWLDRQSHASDFRRQINEYYASKPPDKWGNWVIGDHGKPRAASRLGRTFMDSLHIIQFILPGTVISYMGDELAMEDAFTRKTEMKDERDPERAPFQWKSSVSAGFSTNWTTWLPVNSDYWIHNQQNEAMSKKSHLSVYKSLLKLKSLPIIQHGSLNATTDDEILVIQRFQKEGNLFYVAVINVGDTYRKFDLKKSLEVASKTNWRVYASSLNCEHLEDEEIDISSIKLRPKAGLVLANHATCSKEDYKTCEATFKFILKMYEK